MCIYLCKLYDMGIDVLRRMEDILTWNDPSVGIMDMGDDAVVGFDTLAGAMRFREVLEQQDYYQTGVEANSYLGNIIFKDHPEDKHVFVRPNGVSYINNPITRERDIDSKFSPYWAKGYEARQAVYRTSPSYGALHEIMDSEFQDVMGYRLEDAIRAHPNYHRSISPANWADALLLDDPEKLHYRFRPGDLSPELEAAYTMNVEVADFVDQVTPYIRAVVN
jgi:hypothetical protein